MKATETRIAAVPQWRKKTGVLTVVKAMLAPRV